jgi:hypothetical protein
MYLQGSYFRLHVGYIKHRRKRTRDDEGGGMGTRATHVTVVAPRLWYIESMCILKGIAGVA